MSISISLKQIIVAIATILILVMGAKINVQGEKVAEQSNTYYTALAEMEAALYE